ncbi:inactive tyrosine-protein kinase PRAG1-like [Lampris incognitus]|uniref:inactive tyrosine-protein kinase PRAG1-like n=1 Tax=Lampris incognitus TaxID=2546036 RepID=UPI0024B4E6AA|nr:inactive tyrosine-protein kinase PRAG1-like [Lampris incognitus]XP_056146564.1 inactive tyrosine-protein kinase PRAG1-like [Lampris incognitus]
MSACSDFAEHVWKPGSCKNCFHPLSAHHSSGSNLDGSLPTVCKRTSLGGDEEAGVTAPSPYSKPTIAVKPTMMNPDTTEVMADVNMNREQENPKSPVERLGLRKLLDLSSIYIDGNGCSKALKEAVHQGMGTKMDYTNCTSPVPLSSLSPTNPSKDSTIISNIFVTQEDVSGSLKESGMGETVRQNSTITTRTIKSTYNASGVVSCRANIQEPHQASVELPSSVDIIPSCPTTVHNSGINTETTTTVVTELSSISPAFSSTALTLDTITHNPQSTFCSPPALHETANQSDSSCSYHSSMDSLPGPEGLIGGQMGSERPHSPIKSAPNTPNGQPDAEPIYAESTKKKRRPPGIGMQSQSQSQNQIQDSAQCSELSGEGNRATITVMAAHTEENNRTFYLSSPDSAVSTQCHFSPTALKEPSSPAFRWPSPSHSAPSLATDTSQGSPLQLKLQSSPPVPPKRSMRSPKLGTSSLSSSTSSPVSLPDLSMLVLLSPTEGQFKSTSENLSNVFERRHMPNHHGSNWNCRIEEEEEEEEKERKEGEMKKEIANPGTASCVMGQVNGSTVWRETRDWRAHSIPPPMTEPGTAPLPAPNNGACQGQTEGNGAEQEDKHSGSMLAKAPLLASSSEPLSPGKRAPNHEPNHPPPPPPPKKHHRVCIKINGSNMELDRCCQQGGSVESLTQAFQGLGSASLPTASTDSLSADTGSWDATQMACSSPFPRSPMASTSGSPHSDTFIQPPPLPEKKMVNRTVSAPENTNGKPFVRAYPRLPFTGSESNVSRPGDASSRSSLPSSPVDTRPLFSSNESLERCHAPLSRPSRSRTLNEPLKGRGRLGVHCRGSVTCSSSPQLSTPFSASEPVSAPTSGSSLQLQTLLSNIDSREGVYSKLGGLYAESLRRLALKCEDHFTYSQKNPLRFDESNWSLFKLTCNKPSCNAGDAVYYSAACASDPSNSYAVKICKSASMEAKQGHLYGLSVQQSIPPHFNVQQDCGHFIACVPQSMLPSDEVSLPTTPASSLPQPSASIPGQQAERERVVVITREVAQQSAADFVRGWEAFHKAQPEVYERRVCFLLLQLCNGLEHLKENGVTHRDLCLENLLLVPHHRRLTVSQSQVLPALPSKTANENGTSNGSSTADSQRHLPRLLISNFAKAKRRSSEDAASASADPRVKRDHARLAPEIVSAAQYRKFDEFQTGILIYELLHQPNPFEVSPALKEQDYRCENLPPIPTVSLYSAGLQRLAQLLLQPDPIKRIHIQEAKRVLQSLLWGPRKDLMEQQWDRHGLGGGLAEGSRHEGLLNWLDVKRALLMMKFAERSLEPERNAELEDWLCCQYFSSAHPMFLCHTGELLYSLK